MKTLLVVDAQKDFMPGGSLAVPGGDEIVPYINNIRNSYDKIFWTKDWHPADHCSFKENGGIWPIHCVKMSKGSEFHDNLEVHTDEYIVTKGKDPQFDSYSAFLDEGERHTGLSYLLHQLKIKEFDVCGLATEYCVKFTVIDALILGFRVNLLQAGCRGIKTEDANIAIGYMKRAGAILK